MAKTSVLQRPNVDISQGRHDFDRSYTSNMNQSHGELRMVFCEPCVAGTKGIINAKMFTRSAKVVFPAFQQVDQHIEFFKVPLRYLWSKWNDWKVNINDLNSSALVPFSTQVGSYGPDLHMNVGVPRMNIGLQGGQDLITRMGLSSASDKVQVYKMLDDCNEGAYVNAGGSVGGACMVNLFMQAAYQKVYFDHFRNSTYESNNVYAYNLDWLQDVSSSSENVLEPSDGTKESWVAKQLFTIRYKNYRNDYFHNLYPSLNYSQSQPTGQDWTLPNNLQGVANLVNPGNLAAFNTGDDKNRWYARTGTWEAGLANSANIRTASTNNLVGIGLSSEFNLAHNHEVNSAGASSTASINVQQIRAMFALDKLMRASAYAPKHVKEQFEALYGVKLSDKVSFESERLGSFMNTIVFGEVTATSDTYNSSAGTGQQLGAIGGKGVGFTGFRDDINFYCEEDSLIVGIQYFLARANYDNNGIDEWAMKLVKNDFFVRPFEHLGLRPLYKKEIYYTGASSDNNILGFREANMRYKVGIDRNHGLFNINYLNFYTGSPVSSTSELSRFIAHTNMSAYIGMNSGVDYRYFKAFPFHLNYIFEQNYDPTDMSTDQFYGQTHFKFYVNAPMDVHSQPYL